MHKIPPRMIRCGLCCWVTMVDSEMVESNNMSMRNPIVCLVKGEVMTQKF